MTIALQLIAGVKAAERLWPGPLTMTQYALLNYLADSGEVMQSSVIDKTHIDRSTLSEVVMRLKRDRLITRVRDLDDKRRVMIGISDRGRSRLRQTNNKIHSFESQLLSPLKSNEREDLRELLTTLAATHLTQEATT